MSLNEFAMFVTGVIWGIFIIKPVYDIAQKIWKNANIILFTHPHDYVKKRASKDPSISIFYERLADYEENLKEMRSLPNVVYVFDVRKYESETETLDAIKEMYDILGIKGYDREKLATYYNDWYNKINEIAIN